MDDALQFLDSRPDDPTIYGPGTAAGPNNGESIPQTLSLLLMDNSPEGIARREEQFRQAEAAYESQKALLQRDKEILEQWRREQMEDGN
jgi:hypothetical protein